MNELQIQDFIERVVTSRERVQFTQVDPYGHLNTARYAEFMVNHRITAVEDQLKVRTLAIAQGLGVAFVVARLDLRFHAPSFLNEELEVASWVESLHETGFRLRLVISGEKNRKVRATAVKEIRTVDVKTGRVVACPLSLPSEAETQILATRPLAAEYIATLKNYPGRD